MLRRQVERSFLYDGDEIAKLLQCHNSSPFLIVEESDPAPSHEMMPSHFQYVFVSRRITR